jgi:protein TonB
MNNHVERLNHMDREFKPKGAGRRGVGFIVVVVLHLLIGYALVSGLAGKVVEVVKKPVQMAVITEIEAPPPPPPPPPPKVEKIQEPPKVKAPPPPYVPPPDVAPPVQPAAPVIQAVQSEPPTEPVVIAPAPPPATPVVQRAEVSVACPGYQKVLQAALQGAFEQVGVTGTVKVLLRVKGGQVVDATPQGGPKGYYRLVQSAVRRIGCSMQGADELLVPLDVVFREE